MVDLWLGLNIAFDSLSARPENNMDFVTTMGTLPSWKVPEIRDLSGIGRSFGTTALAAVKIKYEDHIRQAANRLEIVMGTLGRLATDAVYFDKMIETKCKRPEEGASLVAEIVDAIDETGKLENWVKIARRVNEYALSQRDRTFESTVVKMETALEVISEQQLLWNTQFSCLRFQLGDLVQDLPKAETLRLNLPAKSTSE